MIEEKIATIVESTRTTSNEHGKGLHTVLLSDEMIDVCHNKKAFSINIETCIVPGNDKYPYETTAFDNNGEKLYQERCDDMVWSHLALIDRYKREFFRTSNIS